MLLLQGIACFCLYFAVLRSVLGVWFRGCVFGGFWGGVRGGHDSVHVRVNILSSALMTHVCALGSLAHCLMSGFFVFWVVCAVSWGRAYVLC